MWVQYVIFFVEKALKFNFDVYGIDISEYSISVAKQNISKDRFFCGVYF